MHRVCVCAIEVSLTLVRSFHFGVPSICDSPMVIWKTFLCHPSDCSCQYRNAASAHNCISCQEDGHAALVRSHAKHNETMRKQLEKCVYISVCFIVLILFRDTFSALEISLFRCTLHSAHIMHARHHVFVLRCTLQNRRSKNNIWVTLNVNFNTHYLCAHSPLRRFAFNCKSIPYVSLLWNVRKNKNEAALDEASRFDNYLIILFCFFLWFILINLLLLILPSKDNKRSAKERKKHTKSKSTSNRNRAADGRRSKVYCATSRARARNTSCAVTGCVSCVCFVFVNLI